jgi:hypothetical protein
MICKKKNIYLIINNAKQTFANLPKFGVIRECLFRLYTSWRSASKNEPQTGKAENRTE